MNKRILPWIVPSLLLCIAMIAVIWSRHIVENGHSRDMLSGTVYGLTEGYQIPQIVTALVIFFTGYFIVACLLPYNPIVYIGLSFPTGIAIWCMESIIILISNIPYCLSAMLIMTGGLVFVLLIWRKEKFKTINYWAAIRHGMYMVSFMIVVSAGFMPIITTYDSHIFIYQFGEMIANQGRLSFDAVGACIAATGIDSALMVSLARFTGFENIQIFHWMLILSLILCVFRHIEKTIKEQTNKKKVMLIVIVLCSLLFGIPSFLYLAHMVNSCTYIMVYITIICLYSFEFSQESRDNGWILISLFLVWLSFGRLEGGVMAAFFVVCIGQLSISRKNMLMIAIPISLLQCAFFLRILLDEKFTALSARENFLSASAVAIIFLSMTAIVLYALYFERLLFKKLRKYLSELIIIGLIAACLLLGVYDSEKLLINIGSTFHNLEFEYWRYFPHTAAIILGGSILYRRKMDWWDCVLFGYAILNFAVCLGRELPLREGFGDSYNRILCGLVPLTFYMMIKRVIELWSKNSEHSYL